MGKDRSVDMSALQDFYRRIWSEASSELSAEFEELAAGIWRISRDGKSTLISNYKVQMDDPVILNIAGNKELTYRMLAARSLPVPDYRSFRCDEIRSAQEFMDRYPGAYFVVKPVEGTSGARGITTHISSFAELVPACAFASLYGDHLLIERYISGEPYRLLVMDGTMIHASRRRGSWITGDGMHTVRQLLEHGQTVDDGDSRIIAELAGQGVTLDTVPTNGRSLYVGFFKSENGSNDNREVRTVFNEDATALIGPALASQAILAAKVMNSRFAGVDVITLDPAVSLENSGGAINEINTTPGLHHHYNLINQGNHRLAEMVVDHLLETGKRGNFVSECLQDNLMEGGQ